VGAGGQEHVGGLGRALPSASRPGSHPTAPSTFPTTKTRTGAGWEGSPSLPPAQPSKHSTDAASPL